MRDLETARDCWKELGEYRTLRELKDAVRLDNSTSIATTGCRTACWKIFLLFDTLETSSWQRTLVSSRSAYNALRTHFLRHLENPDELTADYDPLSEDNETSPWMQLRKDEELRAEILQDVTRCMQEYSYFQQAETQRMLLDMLFIFCKLNPDTSYRQGMHEILAPILWAVEQDAIDLGESSKVMGEDANFLTFFDADHIEHDAFAIFGQVMQSAKNFYEQTAMSGQENPMVVRSRRIFNEMLPLVDQELAKHLERIDIVPQIFLMRWIRLLFGREFALDEVLTMWDVIFAEDTSLDIVDQICVAMLLRIRWDLIEADYNGALTLLLRYPEAVNDFSPQSLTLDALYLREHLDQHSGNYLVSKYTGRSLQMAGRPITPPALQRKVTSVTGSNATKVAIAASAASPSRTARSRNIEAVLQSTAKNIYARSEKLGIGKAVRSAVDEVHKRAQEIRETQTPSPPVAWRQKGSRSSLETTSMLRRITTLENRNKHLSKLLERAVSELWELQGLAAEDTAQSRQSGNSINVEKLSAAIARVQFVQVYLDDSGLSLPDDAHAAAATEEESAAIKGSGPAADLPSEAKSTDPYTAEKRPIAQSSPPSEPNTIPADQHGDLADPSTFEDFPGPLRDPESSVPNIVLSAESSNSQATQSRPRLEHSPFSWMLGQQDSHSRASSNASTFPTEKSRNKGFLFGGDADVDGVQDRDGRSSSER